MSGGESLTIETTALALLALIKASPANEYESQIRAGVDWLNAKRGGYGAWGKHAGHDPRPQGPHRVQRARSPDGCRRQPPRSSSTARTPVPSPSRGPPRRPRLE